MQWVESRSLSFSMMLHLMAIVIAAFGLPALMPEKPDPMPMVMTVELLPIGEISNVKPSDKRISEEKKAPTPKTPKPVQPTAIEKPKEIVAEEKKPHETIEKAEPLPGEKPKPKDEAKPKQDDFQALLNKLKEEAKTDKSKDAKDTTNTPENKTKSDAPYDDSLPLSISEKDMIRSQFIPCWTMPAGAKDAHTLAARVKVKLQADGTVIEAVLAPDQSGRYGSDPFFSAAAGSAIRAVYKCSPLKNLPPEKYNSWKDMEINFNPADL